MTDLNNASKTINKEASMTTSLLEKLESIKTEVITTVTDNKTINTVNNVINEEKAKINACVAELVKRGKQSDVAKFVSKCMDTIMGVLHSILGHMKLLWARIVKVFTSINSKQQVMAL